jgi:uncharacterized protein (DUF1800 family)
MSSALERWKPGRGEFDRGAAAHLLARAGLGYSAEQLESALERGLDATVDALFDEPAHDPALLTAIDTLLGAGKIEALQAWWMALILGGRAPLRERLTLHWHDHFATSWDKVQDVRLMHGQNELFRARGAGDFRVLLREVARDPAMLVWLDGNSNRKGHANENFAREVLELFALGIGNYTERDVTEAARAFTGWGVDARKFRFAAKDHDEGEKLLFGRSGALDGEAALEQILAQPACSRHIATRLLREFGGTEPSVELVSGLARELVAGEWSIGRALAVILRSRWFHAPERRRNRIAGPVELVALSVRKLGASIAPARAAAACHEMGQTLFRPPSVKGWDGGRAWINAGTWLARHEFLVELAHAAATASAAQTADSWQAHWRALNARALAERVQERLLQSQTFADALEQSIASAGGDPLEPALVLALTAPEYHLT